MAVIAIKAAHVDQVIRSLEQRVSASAIQEPLVETAELFAELRGEELLLESNTSTSLNERMVGLAARTALLEAQQQRLVDCLKTLKGQVSAGQHKFSTATPGSNLPPFETLLRDLYGGGVASSSSSSSSSPLIALSDEEALKHRNHTFVKEVVSELQTGEDQPLDDDDDLAVVNKKTATNLKVEVTCPILQSIITKPLTCKLCKHSFEESAVLELLRKAKDRTIKCPISGCGTMFKQSDLERNDKLERKIKKYHKDALSKQKRAESEEDDMLVV